MSEQDSDPVDVADDVAAEKDVAGSHGKDAKGRFGPGNAYRWKPGQPGNPNGFTRARRLVKAIEDELDRVVTTSGATAGAAVARRLVSIAAGIRGVHASGALEPPIPYSAMVMAAREVLDRVDGKVPLPLRMTNQGAQGGMASHILIETVPSPDLTEYKRGTFVAKEPTVIDVPVSEPKGDGGHVEGTD